MISIRVGLLVQLNAIHYFFFSFFLTCIYPGSLQISRKPAFIVQSVYYYVKSMQRHNSNSYNKENT